MKSNELILIGLAQALDATKNFAETPGTVQLWSCVITMVGSVPADFGRIDALVRSIELLHEAVGYFKCEYGLMVYSLGGTRVNVNMALPQPRTNLFPLLHHTIEYLTKRYYAYAISFSPLLQNFPELVALGGTMRPRRVIPERHVVKRAFLREDMVHCLGFSTPIVERLTDPRAVVKYKPLTMLDVADEVEQLYWHRFPCGAIVVLRNTIVESAVDSVVHPPVGLERAIDIIHSPTICNVLQAIFRPRGEENALRNVGNTDVPCYVHALCVWSFFACYNGVTDGLIRSMGEEHRCRNTLIDNMVDMSSLIHDTVAFSERFLREGLLDKLSTLLSTFKTSSVWIRWCSVSPYVRECLYKTADANALCRSLIRFPGLVHICTRILSVSIGTWTNIDMVKASVLLDSRFDAIAEARTRAELQRVRAEVLRRNQRANKVAERMLRSEHVARTLSDKKPLHVQSIPLCSRARPVPSTSDIRLTACTESARTHEHLVDRLCTLVGFPCRLIGSGTFCDTGDVDIVITVSSAETLAEAYELVRGRTGWTALYENITGEHVSILSGTIRTDAGRDLPVDAQVWRGVAGPTRAEKETHRAMKLTDTLSEQMSTTHRSHAVTLHRWFMAVDLKGHRLCRLSGVGITCVAIVLGCRARECGTMRWLLTRVRDAISRDAPHMDLDKREDLPSGVEGRCVAPLYVMTHGNNVASRMSAGTTRHLLDALAFALDCTDDRMASREVYDRWRRETMVQCAHVFPRCKKAVSMTLHRIASQLDGHPLVDAVHFTEHADGMLIVFILPCASADASRYGFQDDDMKSISLDDTNGRVMLTRGNKLLPLVTCTCEPTVADWASRSSVRDRLSIPGHPTMTVLNAPTLHTDVLSCFDMTLWKTFHQNDTA